MLGDAETFLRIVAEDRAGRRRSSEGDGAFEFRYRGDAEQASDLLAGWSAGGVRVASFARRKDNLEELFLKVGARELS